MKLQNTIVKAGQTLIYDDGRAGHRAECLVLETFTNGIRVQFSDRARPTTILSFEAAWTNHMTVKG